ncbi:hypothetical protein [Streptomyces sp. NBC_01451]|uniref:hypothetical protein n=1 Tax=Streptomyces sp. NBC_01451 TaxID=2903872 RepID=UPI002E373E74|nr:hypothetical protein [Streptomyces sp. NBC_01451]
MPAAVPPEPDLHRLPGLLGEGHLVTACVAKKTRPPAHDPERRGGHRVLAIGHTDGTGRLAHPVPDTIPQTLAPVLSLDRFGDFFAGRGVRPDLRRTVRLPAARPSTARPAASQPTT